MLDLWREAFRHINRLPPAEAATQLNKFILNHPQLQNPQASQLRLTTGHAWKTYAMGPNAIPNARPGMFLQTLPAPVYRDDRVRREAENDERAKLNQSLYADGGFNLTLSLEDYWLPDPPLTEAQINSHKIFGTPLPVHPPRYGRLYRRGGGSGRSETEPNSSSLGREVATGGTNEFPIELFQPPEISEEEIDGVHETYPHLQTVAEALAGPARSYFTKPNWKTGDPFGSGPLPMHDLIVMGRIYAGKQTTPLAHLSEGDAIEDLLEFGQQHLSGMILYSPILDGIDMVRLSKAMSISEQRLNKIVKGAQMTNTEVKAMGTCLKIDQFGIIKLDPPQRKLKDDLLRDKVHKVGVSKGLKGYDELAAYLSVPVAAEMMRRIGCVEGMSDEDAEAYLIDWMHGTARALGADLRRSCVKALPVGGQRFMRTRLQLALAAVPIDRRASAFHTYDPGDRVFSTKCSLQFIFFARSQAP
jgi:hypothetical protein